MLLLGVGNRMRGDDGIGPEVASRVALLGIPEVEVVVETEPVAVLEHLRDAPAHEALVVVDATAPAGRPGRVVVHPVGAERLVGRESPFGSHGLGVVHAVELARALGWLPPRLTLVGVEAGSTALGGGLSAAVRDNLDEAVDAVVAALTGASSASDRT